MKIHTLALLAVMFAPVTLQACDCGCDDAGTPSVHFKDGIAPNGPVTAAPLYANPECYSTGYGFRDYGSAHVVIAPPPVDTKEMKQPSS